MSVEKREQYYPLVPLFTTAEWAAHLRISRPTLDQARKEGRITIEGDWIVYRPGAVGSPTRPRRGKR